MSQASDLSNLSKILSGKDAVKFTSGPNILHCPVCKHQSSFNRVSMVDQVRIQNGAKTNTSAHFFQCSVCNQAMMVHSPLPSSSYLNKEELARCIFYPGHSPVVELEIPDKVKAIFNEALDCYSVNAWNAVGTMCRRAIQEAVLIHKAEGAILYKQIENLVAKGVIVELLAKASHQVRIIGKDGAHADTFVDLTQNDADRAVHFCNQLFNYLFVLPTQLSDKSEAP